MSVSRKGGTVNMRFAVAVVIVGIAGLVGCTDEDAARPAQQSKPQAQAQAHTKKDLLARVEATPGIPLALPVDLRSDYQLMRMEGERQEKGRTFARIYRIAPRPLSAAVPAATVCVIEEGRAERTAEQPCKAPHDDLVSNVVVRRFDGLTVIVRFDKTPSEEVADYWRRTPLTADISRVSWLA